MEKMCVFVKVIAFCKDHFLLATSSPDIIFAGDVRNGAMNRVTCVVGEREMGNKFVHEYQAEN